MYELVNTSLPNGLIPGSHGFAVAAMTRGLPDVLRTRLEAYCAYSHRTSVHDATYFTENPVNWFHVTLPQGDHVMGRVAPADFDYTGRTNRLARLLVFPKNEMPAIGGASVLKKECARLSEAWSGAARWLEADKLTVGRLRLENLQTNCDAPSWRAMFGNDEGLNLARGFARLLAKNLSTTGRTIYFKTSTAYDVDGTRLLALFADLIDLLPVVDRSSVTFSTYPVALPQGTICHLRGVYDRDRIFDASAATQPWVDCEKGVVHNASLLPPEEVKQRSVEPKVVAAPVRTTQQPASTSGARPQKVPAWMPKKKDGTKSLFFGIITIAIILVTLAAIYGIQLWRESERKRCENERARQQAAEEAKRDAENKREKEAIRRKEEAAQKAKAEEDRKKAESDKKKAAEAKAKQELENERKREAERARNERNADLEKGKRESQNPQNKEASTLGDVKSVEDITVKSGGIQDIAKEKNHVKANGTLKVFFYDNSGVLTNYLAGFVTGKPKKIGNHEYKANPEFKPKLDDLNKKMSRHCAFLIWYDTQDKRTYWDWSPLYGQDAVKWFVNTNTIDLVDMCFGGTTNEVYKTWEKYCGAPLFTIDWVTADGKKIDWVTADGKSIPVLSKVERTLRLDELVKMYGEWEKKQQNPVANEGKDKLAKYSAQKTKIEKARKEYKGLYTRFEENRKAETKCKDNNDKPELREEIKKIKRDIDALWKQEIGVDKSFFAVSLKYDEHTCKIEGWDDLLKKLGEEIDKLQASQTPPKKEDDERKKIRDIISQSNFSIIKVKRTKQ